MHVGRLLKTWPERDGYLVVKLGQGRNHFVHRLVLLAFTGPCPDGMEALHDNGVHGDARLSNLRWGTKSENCLDLVRHGTHVHARRTHCPRNHPLKAPNLDPSNLRSDGSRSCWACALARHAIKHALAAGSEAPDLRVESDRQYERILSGGVPTPRKDRTHCPRNHPLTMPNLVPGQARRGMRSCWACALAQAHIRNCRRAGKPEPEIQVEADRQYERIIHGEVASTTRRQSGPPS